MLFYSSGDVQVSTVQTRLVIACRAGITLKTGPKT